MTPDNYKSPDGPGKYQGPDRRVTQDEKATIHDVITIVRVIEQKIEGLEDKVEQRLSDNRAMADVQYQHFDAIFEQMRRENDQRRSDDLQQHRDLIATFEKQISVTIDLYRDHERAQDTRFDDIETRLACLEKAPGTAALNKREKVRDAVVGALVATGGLAVFGVIAAVVRWDDFVKMIGGGK